MEIKLVSGALFLAVLFIAPPVSAQDDPKGTIHEGAEESVPTEKHERTWYGKQTLVADGISLATFTLGAVMGESFGSILMGTGLAGYALGAPAVHMSRGYVGRGFADAGMRAGLAAGVGLIGAVAGLPAFDPAAGKDSKDGLTASLDPVLIGGATGLFLGAVLASAIDAGILAHDNAKKIGLTPTATAMRGGVSVGLGGTF